MNSSINIFVLGIFYPGMKGFVVMDALNNKLYFIDSTKHKIFVEQIINGMHDWVGLLILTTIYLCQRIHGKSTGQKRNRGKML